MLLRRGTKSYATCTDVSVINHTVLMVPHRFRGWTSSSRRWGSARSKGRVSRLCAEIDERVQTFLRRPIEGEWPSLWLDATYVKARREVLGMTIGNSEAEPFWTKFALAHTAQPAWRQAGHLRCIRGCPSRRCPTGRRRRRCCCGRATVTSSRAEAHPRQPAGRGCRRAEGTAHGRRGDRHRPRRDADRAVGGHVAAVLGTLRRIALAWPRQRGPAGAKVKHGRSGSPAAAGRDSRARSRPRTRGGTGRGAAARARPGRRNRRARPAGRGT